MKTGLIIEGIECEKCSDTIEKKIISKSMGKFRCSVDEYE